MKLDVILRTCQKSQFDNKMGNKDTAYVRICGSDREQMVYRCVMSLINSINRANYNIKFTILDDNSDELFIDKLNILLKRCNKETELVRLEKTGPNNSAYEQFYRASQCEDLVYSVEDDFLHEPDAITYMINAYQYFNSKYQEDTVIFPFDCPFRYEEGRQDTTQLYHDGLRYWRHVRYTTNTFLTTGSQLRRDFDTYKDLALNYPNVLEDDTINKLYHNLDTGEGQVRVFSPIPSCAYHLSYQEPFSIHTPQLQWQHLWDSNHYLQLFEGWFNYDPFFNMIVNNLPDNAKVIEVGSWLGKSTIGMVNTSKRFGKNFDFYAIDTWEGSEEPKHYETIAELKEHNHTPYDEFMANLELYGVKGSIVPIQKTSEEASNDFHDEYAELIIIDAAHDYDNVTNDIKHWLPKVKKGGILCGDDYDEKWPEVMAAVKDYFGEGNYQVYGSTWYKVIQ
jgi:hypothetical protein